jgi:hypothetical protein
VAGAAARKVSPSLPHEVLALTLITHGAKMAVDRIH